MLFTQHNGLAQAVSDDNISQLQEIACGLGPQIDGIAASIVRPQSMGAFSTQGATSACMMHSQQAEQHQPTTTSHREFGNVFGAVNTALLKSTGMPSTMMQSSTPKSMTATEPNVFAPQGQPMDPYGPAASLPTGAVYPAGTITAFNASTNMWRVATPPVGPATRFTETAPTLAPAPSARQVSEREFEKQTGQSPIWKRWQFWAAIGGGVAVLGTGTALLFRRKRPA